jgi:hypothetical protein
MVNFDDKGTRIAGYLSSGIVRKDDIDQLLLDVVLGGFRTFPGRVALCERGDATEGLQSS